MCNVQNRRRPPGERKCPMYPKWEGEMSRGQMSAPHNETHSGARLSESGVVPGTFVPISSSIYCAVVTVKWRPIRHGEP